MNSNEIREYRVFAIEEGTVIDHIPSPLGLKVINVLQLPTEGIMSIGLNFPSEKLGQKDLIKIENRYLEEEDTDKLALIAPTATINIIKHHTLAEKRKIKIPEEVVDIMHCPNPVCITNHEEVQTHFIISAQTPLEARCYYCEREFTVTPDLII